MVKPLARPVHARFGFGNRPCGRTPPTRSRPSGPVPLSPIAMSTRPEPARPRLPPSRLRNVKLIRSRPRTGRGWARAGRHQPTQPWREIPQGERLADDRDRAAAIRAAVSSSSSRAVTKAIGTAAVVLPVAQAPGGFRPGQSGHYHVEEDEVRRVVRDRIQGLPSGGAGSDLEGRVETQAEADDVADVALVVDMENLDVFIDLLA